MGSKDFRGNSDQPMAGTCMPAGLQSPTLFLHVSFSATFLLLHFIASVSSCCHAVPLCLPSLGGTARSPETPPSPSSGRRRHLTKRAIPDPGLGMKWFSSSTFSPMHFFFCPPRDDLTGII
ncbi:hypothetical protein IF1G_03463 [Cordyceps javanica]|uniref:Uncharacterized protein n=1 Tax=Cordyceps javanica TaxID=43265 RepID=A0A545V7M6_9HYPO|nr:hypothetical protein IF1G_03463 [Cordyceps javanica]